MKKLYVYGTLFVSFWSSVAWSNCSDLFLAEPEVQVESNYKSIIEEFDQYKGYSSLRRWNRATSLIKYWSGNTVESSTRISRIRMGERFKRILRSGDVVRAINYVRPLMQSIRTSAEIIVWAQQGIVEIENELANVKLSSSQYESRLEMLQQLKTTVMMESRSFSRYGDYMRVISELNNFRKAIDENNSTQAPSQLELNLGKQSTAADLDVNQKQRLRDLEQISRSITGMGSWTPLYPNLFKIKMSEVTGRKYKSSLDEKINAEADFVSYVLHNRVIPGNRAYGAELPLLAILKKEFAWEVLAAFKNVVGVVTKRYTAIMSFIDRGNTADIADKLVENPKTSGVKISSQKLLQVILSDLSIIEAIEKHSQHIYLLEDLFAQFKKNLITREEYVAALGSASAGNGNDLLSNFARIKEFQPLFRESMDLVRQQSEETKTKFEKLESGNWSEDLLFKKMREAQRLVESGALSEISSTQEPEFVHMVIKQGVAFGGGLTFTTMSTLYLLNPEKFAAIKNLLFSWVGQ